MSEKRVTPLKAIRLKCLDCSCQQPHEVRLCPHTECASYQYRFGKNPARRGMGGKTGSFSQKTLTQQAISNVKVEDGAKGIFRGSITVKRR